MVVDNDIVKSRISYNNVEKHISVIKLYKERGNKHAYLRVQMQMW